MASFKDVIRATVDFFIPRHCVVCGGRLSHREHIICSGCFFDLRQTELWKSPEHNVLLDNLPTAFPVVKAAAFIYYIPDSEEASVVKHFKYGHDSWAAIYCGYLMARQIITDSDFFNGIDCLVPVPLSKKRLRERGYNQTEMLCKGIKKALDERGPNQCEIITDALVRVSFVQSQTMLSHWQRSVNVSNVFRLEHPEMLTGKHVLIVDDVVTTGATTTACMTQMKDVPGIRLSLLAFSLAGHW